MRIDAARHDDAPGGVDLARRRLRRKRAGSGHRGDGLAGDRDVALDDALRRDHVTATNDDVEHAASREHCRAAAAILQCVGARRHCLQQRL